MKIPGPLERDLEMYLNMGKYERKCKAQMKYCLLKNKGVELGVAMECCIWLHLLNTVHSKLVRVLHYTTQQLGIKTICNK
jgi:hypothetical protein